ncbi:MAG TPA: hypothetical protein VFQ90_12700 [Stellaceae bacterium]|jgi:hypothetical protein|nr:hypothetical protein [Stellaceae bacterium]
MLSLWEKGANRHALDRSLLLCAWARPDLSDDTIADLPLGTVTASLLRLREASFGTRIDCHVDCEHCGERIALALFSPDLLQPATENGREIEVLSWRARAPSLRDLAAAAGDAGIDRAARRLLAGCGAGDVAEAEAMPEDGFRRVEDALEALDPNADLALDLACAACGRTGIAQLDVGALLWDEIDAHARGLLSEVDALARAYGWTEGEILGLGAVRRGAYLAMVVG